MTILWELQCLYIYVEVVFSSHVMDKGIYHRAHECLYVHITYI